MEAVVSVFNINSNFMGRQAVRGNWGINTPLMKNSAEFPSGPLDILLLFVLLIVILVWGFLMFYLSKVKPSFLDILLFTPPIIVLLYYTFRPKFSK
jgi:hypothetical protein